MSRRAPASLLPALRAAGSDACTGSTVGEILASAAACLRSAGIESARREARVLVAHGSGLGHAVLFGYPERTLPPDKIRDIDALIRRRTAGEPLSRIVGRREFWSLDFHLSPHTLDPRPDSETLVEAVLELLPDRDRPLRILDLGTGSGCLLLALLSELPQAFGIGVDASAGACVTAAKNARALKLAGRAAFVVADWATACSGGFDVVVSNPPYVLSSEIPRLAAEVREYDPHAALCGGEDGLAAYRAIVRDLPRLLRSEGFVAFEIGAGQHSGVAALLGEAGIPVVAVRRDLAGIERCLIARPENPRADGEKGFQNPAGITTVLQGFALHSG